MVIKVYFHRADQLLPLGEYMLTFIPLLPQGEHYLWSQSVNVLINISTWSDCPSPHFPTGKMGNIPSEDCEAQVEAPTRGLRHSEAGKCQYSPFSLRAIWKVVAFPREALKGQGSSLVVTTGAPSGT